MVLVTGATGLVGSHFILRFIENGRSIKAIYNHTLPKLQHPNLEWVKADITQIEQLHTAFIGVDEVYHCGAKVSFSNKEDASLYSINVIGTRHIVNLCLHYKIKKLLYVSSIAVLNAETDTDIQETLEIDNYSPRSMYGKTKYLAEIEVWRGISEGLQAIIVLPSIILGWGDWNKSSLVIFKQAYQSFPFYTKGGTGFVDVKDVVNASILLMENQHFGERFILNGYNARFRTIFNLIAKNFNKKLPYIYLSLWLSYFLGFVLALFCLILRKKTFLTFETIASAHRNLSFDNSKLLKVLPNFSYTPLEQSIHDICSEYEENLQTKS